MSFADPTQSFSKTAITIEPVQAGRCGQQFAALCYRRPQGPTGSVEVLLITSRESRRWIIPKGWPMRKKKAHEVASVEAWEEAGVRGRVHKKAWGDYAYLKKMTDEELLPTKVQVHLLDVRELADDFPEHGQRQRRWFDPLTAASVVREPELRVLLARFDEQENARRIGLPEGAGQISTGSAR